MKINRKILILGAGLLLLVAVIFATVGLNSSNNSSTDTAEEVREITDVFNDGDYQETKSTAEDILNNEGASDEDRAQAFELAFNARIGETGPEAGYQYLIENREIINSLDLGFDFYYAAGTLAEEFENTEFAIEMYEKVLGFEFEEGFSEELLIQDQIEEKLNEIR